MKIFVRARLILLLSGSLVCAVLTPATFAQGVRFPGKAITIIAPFAAGGPADIVARSIAAPLARILKQSVVVENAAGAAGIVGTLKAMRAAPDGYTLLLGHSGTHAFNPALYPSLQYRPLEDFRPVALLAAMPSVLSVNASSRFGSVTELITYAHANPNKLLFGSAGSGSVSHLAAIMLTSAADIDVVFVPYRGSNPAFTDLISGQIDALFDLSLQAVPMVMGGRVKALAVTSTQRLSELPNAPTLEEACCRNLALEVWFGLFAPKNTPDDVLLVLERAALASLGDSRFRSVILKSNARVPEAAQANHNVFEATIRRDIARFGDLARRHKLVAE